MSARYDFARIEAHARVRAADLDPKVTDVAIAAQLGTNPWQVRRWREIGVTADQAERLADALGFVCCEVWPEVLADAVAALERVCEADGCDTVFVLPLRHPHKRYCSVTCKSREGARRAYRADPEPKREANRRRAANERDVKRRYNRAYYRINRRRLLAAQFARDEAKRSAARSATAAVVIVDNKKDVNTGREGYYDGALTCSDAATGASNIAFPSLTDGDVAA